MRLASIALRFSARLGKSTVRQVCHNNLYDNQGAVVACFFRLISIYLPEVIAMQYSYLDADHNGRKSFELPGSKPHYTPDRPGQVEHIYLDLVLDIPRKSYGGTCQIRLNPVRNGIVDLTLDAVSLQIEAVQVDDLAQSFNYDGEQLQIRLSQPTVAGSPIAIVITYRSEQPQRGIYFIAPDADYPEKPTQVWTQGEDEDSRFWFPCFDYPGQLATSEIRVRVPSRFLAISNG